MLEVRDLSAGYGTLAVLRQVTLAVGEREIVTLLGPNGAGKTTLFRTICGQIRPSEGGVAFRGHELGRMSMWDIARLGIGYVPEGRQLFGSLSVRDNLELAAVHGAKLRGSALQEQVDSAFKLFPILGERQRQQAATLSGGQQQMLAIARAMTSRPAFLVLDEPSLGLAPRVVEEIFRTIGAIHRQGVGVLLIEQNAAALEISDRVYVLERGRIALTGRASELVRDRAVERLFLSGTIARPGENIPDASG